MTTDEIYEIAQKTKGECVTLGWFEDNNPCKENWREEVCYYVNHTVDEVEVFWYRKEDGRIIHNIKIVKNGDFDEIQSKKINLSWIRKVNGNPVDMRFMDFKNDWAYRMLKLTNDIHYWYDVCKSQFEHKFSSNFWYYWKDIVLVTIETRDVNKTRSRLCNIHWKSWDKLLGDLKIVFSTAYLYNKNWMERKRRDNYNDVQLFQFLHNLFLTEDVKTDKTLYHEEGNN